jgi:hypothetical protein
LHPLHPLLQPVRALGHGQRRCVDVASVRDALEIEKLRRRCTQI